MQETGFTHVKRLKIYNDGQNVHDSTINKSIFDSIYAIWSFNISFSLDEIINDDILSKQTKQLLVEYCELNDIHSILNVTFLDVFKSVWNIIKNHEHSKEIKSILNVEMNDSLCKCFTGRLPRLVNCLNGFDERVMC